MAISIEYRRGDGIQIQADTDTPASSRAKITATVKDAASATAALNAVKALTIPAGLMVIGGVDVSECMAASGGGDAVFLGMHSCDTGVYRASADFANTLGAAGGALEDPA